MSPPVAVVIEPVDAVVSDNSEDDDAPHPADWYIRMCVLLEEEWREHMILEMRSRHYDKWSEKFDEDMTQIWSEYVDNECVGCPCEVLRRTNDCAGILHFMFKDMGDTETLKFGGITDIYNCWVMSQIKPISYEEYENYRMNDDTRYELTDISEEETKD